MFQNYINVEKSGLIGQYDENKIYEEILMCVRILALKQTNDMGKRFLMTCFYLVQKTLRRAVFSVISLTTKVGTKINSLAMISRDDEVWQGRSAFI